MSILKLKATEKPTPKQMTLKEVPGNTLFRLARTGTVYFKAADGSIRNISKQAKKAERTAKKVLLKMGHTPQEANELIKAAANVGDIINPPTQEDTPTT
jgi:hypothetical protein